MASPKERRRQVQELLRRCEEQGFKVRETSSGAIVYAKDSKGGLVVIHWTPSDHRAAKNTIAHLRKIGVEL